MGLIAFYCTDQRNLLYQPVDLGQFSIVGQKMKIPSEIYPPSKVDVPLTVDETAFEDIEEDDDPGSSNDPHQSTVLRFQQFQYS